MPSMRKSKGLVRGRFFLPCILVGTCAKADFGRSKKTALEDRGVTQTSKSSAKTAQRKSNSCISAESARQFLVPLWEVESITSGRRLRRRRFVWRVSTDRRLCNFRLLFLSLPNSPGVEARVRWIAVEVVLSSIT